MNDINQEVENFIVWYFKHKSCKNLMAFLIGQISENKQKIYLNHITYLRLNMSKTNFQVCLDVLLFFKFLKCDNCKRAFYLPQPNFIYFYQNYPEVIKEIEA